MQHFIHPIILEYFPISGSVEFADRSQTECELKASNASTVTVTVESPMCGDGQWWRDFPINRETGTEEDWERELEPKDYDVASNS